MRLAVLFFSLICPTLALCETQVVMLGTITPIELQSARVPQLRLSLMARPTS